MTKIIYQMVVLSSLHGSRRLIRNACSGCLGANKKAAPMTLKVANLVGSRGQDWELLTAAAFVSMALPVVVFFSLQRYFVRGILAGSVKG